MALRKELKMQENKGWESEKQKNERVTGFFKFGTQLVQKGTNGVVKLGAKSADTQVKMQSLVEEEGECDLDIDETDMEESSAFVRVSEFKPKIGNIKNQ